jgi:hypothetical protein
MPVSNELTSVLAAIGLAVAAELPVELSALGTSLDASIVGGDAPDGEVDQPSAALSTPRR